MTTVYDSDKVALWLQRSCTGSMEFLGCHDATDLVKNRGEIVATRKRTGKGKFTVVKTRQNTPDLDTITLSYFRETVNLLSELPCPFNIYVFYSQCGADDDPTNYDFFDYLKDINPTTFTQAAVANALQADGATDVGVDVVVEVATSISESLVGKPLIDNNITISALSNRIVSDVSICDPDPECGECDVETIGCQTIWIITNGSPGFYGDAEIYKSTDGGTTWTQQTNSMTADSDNLSAVSCDGDVVIITNGTTSEYQFSNDGGTTWTLVTTPDQVINDVFVLGPTKIWFAANGGNIYFSSDKGASISTQDDGVATAQNLNSIHFSDSQLGYAVGNSNAFVRSTDGTTWAAVTGPAVGVNLNVVRSVPDTDIVYVGDANGVVYRSTDKGATWTTILTGVTALAGGISDIAVCECPFLLVAGNDANGKGAVRRSIDGGQTFTSETVSGVLGADSITALACCNPNEYFGVGDNGLIFKLAGQSFKDTA